MDSSPVSHLYERYKLGTKQVVDWLVDTARVCHDITKILDIPDSKVANRANKKSQNKQSHNNGAGQRIALTKQHLLRLTDTIVSGPREIVDSQGVGDIVKVLENVIRLRRECAEWYDDKEDGHQHFIEVLRQILAKLETRFPNDNTQMEDTAEARPRPKNKFTALEVDEPSLTPLGKEQESKASLRPVDKLPATTNFELEQQPDDKSIAIFCMFKDCNDIRDSIRKTWRDYLKGSITLATAYQVTYTACALMQCAVDDFISKYPELATFNEVYQFLAHQGSYKTLYPPTHEPQGPASLALALKRYRSDLCIDAFSALMYLFEWVSIREAGSNDTPQALSHMDPAYVEGLLSHPLIRSQGAMVHRHT